MIVLLQYCGHISSNLCSIIIIIIILPFCSSSSSYSLSIILMVSHPMLPCSMFIRSQNARLLSLKSAGILSKSFVAASIFHTEYLFASMFFSCFFPLCVFSLEYVFMFSHMCAWMFCVLMPVFVDFNRKLLLWYTWMRLNSKQQQQRQRQNTQ